MPQRINRLHRPSLVRPAARTGSAIWLHSRGGAFVSSQVEISCDAFLYRFEAFIHGAELRPGACHRLITDIVDSTKRVAEAGNPDWLPLLYRHDNATHDQISGLVAGKPETVGWLCRNL
jgi:hypothetical protein